MKTSRAREKYLNRNAIQVYNEAYAGASFYLQVKGFRTAGAWSPDMEPHDAATLAVEQFWRDPDRYIKMRTKYERAYTRMGGYRAMDLVRDRLGNGRRKPVARFRLADKCRAYAFMGPGRGDEGEGARKEESYYIVESLLDPHDKEAELEVDELIEKLPIPKRLRTMVRMRYDGCTYKEIGKHLGVTESRMCQLSKALARDNSVKEYLKERL